MDKKFYTVITRRVVGIFDAHWKCKKIIEETPTFDIKVFAEQHQAEGYIRRHLSESDRRDFGLDRCPPYVNKKFVRKSSYIANKEQKCRDYNEAHKNESNAM